MVDALFVGNMLGGAVNGQENLGALLADAAGLLPAEAWRVEAACASGGAAVRAGALAVASGAYDVALAVGVEKMTDGAPEQVTAGLAAAADQDYEASHGLGFTALSALLMRRYMEETGQGREAFAPFAVTAHRNAAANPRAMFREPITAEAFARCPVVAAPIGAHDAFTIITALSLEACGFAPRGQALRLAAEGCFAPGGKTPISTCGGLKARGHPVGASGAYQVVEAVLQLRGEAGANQVKGARHALTQSIGGHGSVAVTHVLEA